MIIFRKRLRIQCTRIIPIVAIFVLYYLGVFTLFFEKSYSLYVVQVDGQISEFVKQWLNNEVPEVSFYNNYDYNYIYNCKKKCEVDDGPLRLVYIVKSATRNFERRDGIRNSWGFEKRFSDVEIRTVFMLGMDSDENIQKKIEEESKERGDIVQANFQDSYYNNTIKTMMSFKWVVNYCNKAKFYFFSDDDMYVSTKNVLRFVRNPLEYPGYLEVPVRSSINRNEDKDTQEEFAPAKRIHMLDMELQDDNELYAGYVFRNSRPMRYKFSKWYVPLSEYPYDSWPPYVTAGAYVLSNRALKKLFYASMYVPHFKFDDIYLSMLALAVNIVPLHNAEFYFYKKSYEPYGYRYVIASHGYENPDELRWVWNDQKSSGNA